MKKIIFLFLVALGSVHNIRGQDVFAIIDSVNSKIIDNCASFSYDIKVENIKDSVTVLLDKGRLIVNHTPGKYDDFLFISDYKNDSFCLVKDTLLWISAGHIRKDHDPNVLHRLLGTSKMFFRCYTPSFRNDTRLINPDRWDELSLDSIDSKSYFLTLLGTMTLFDMSHKIRARLVIDKNSFHIAKYFYLTEVSGGDSISNVFTFSNWTSSKEVNKEIYAVFEQIRQNLLRSF